MSTIARQQRYCVLVACVLLSTIAACGGIPHSRSRRMKQATSAFELSRPSLPSGFSGVELSFQLCSSAFWDERLVVAARYEEDVSWMATELVPWLPFLVYDSKAGNNATHTVSSEAGRESQVYLQFITDYYECLPEAVVFIHAHRSAPHSADIVSDLRRLRWNLIPGFLSLSRPQQQNTFYFAEAEIQKPSVDDTSETAHWMKFAFEQNILIQRVWSELFQAGLGDIPDRLTAPRGGQFAVTSEAIRRRPLQFYEGLLNWLQTTEEDKFWAGLIFEQMWSYIFGSGVEYSHPSECAVFACDKNDEAVTPRWESLIERQLSAQNKFKQPFT